MLAAEAVMGVPSGPTRGAASVDEDCAAGTAGLGVELADGKGLGGGVVVSALVGLALPDGMAFSLMLRAV